MYYWRSYSYSARAQDSVIYLPPELAGLIGKVRAADPGCCWFFEPAAPSGTEGIGIWVESVPEVMRLAGFRPGTRQICYPGLSGRDVRDELSAASSDFALRLLTAGTCAQRTPTALAVAHMRIIAWLVPEAGRLPFLFQCWHHWAAALSPQARIECGEDARLWVGSVAPERAWTGLEPAWNSYQQAVRRIIGETRTGAAAPVNYLLFDHAHRTHARLGIRPAAEALAARVVRAEHAAGAAFPDLAAVAELDPV
jgi:hypothetical protein